MRYVRELKRPAWGEGEYWRLIDARLADLGDLDITDITFDGDDALFRLNLYP